jgi:CheY-like chemotaxis protein
MLNQIKNILLADDDLDDIEVFQIAVNEGCADLKLTVATDGIKLMKMLTTMPKPDAIFLDLNMPYKSGKDCLLEIRKNTEYDSVAVIILSTSSQKAEIDFCLKHGANNYLVKPSTYQGIKNIVAMVCTGNVNKADFLHGSNNKVAVVKN